MLGSMTGRATRDDASGRRLGTRLAVALLGLGLGVASWLLLSQDSGVEPPRPAASDRPRGPIDDAEPREPSRARPPLSASSLATVWVEVVSSEGAPVMGARVKLSAAVGTREQRTDDGGLSTFERLWPGVYATEVTAAGFKTLSGHEELRPGLEEVAWTFRLQPEADAAAALRGLVRSEGKPVAGALVTFLRDGVALPEGAALSSADGRFALPRAAAAKADALLAFHEAHGVTQRALPESGEALMELPAPGFVEGRVLDQRGRPLASFQVQALVSGLPDGLVRALSMASGHEGRYARAVQRRLSVPWRSFGADAALEGDEPPASTASGVPGSFRFGPVPAGLVRVVASADGRAPAEASVPVKPGEVSGAIELRLAGPLVVSGCVTDAESGEPIRAARVRAVRAPGPRAPGFGEASTGADGCYRMLTEPDVRHSVSVHARGYVAESAGGLFGRSDDEVRRDFTLEASRGAHRAGFNYVGIGAKLSAHDEGAKVVGVFESGSAAGALEEGDVVLRVDGVWTEGMPLSRIVELIVGEDGTEVELLVQPKGGGPVETVVLARQPTSSRG